jgi:electron transfer flavoprotein alpha subunit
MEMDTGNGVLVHCEISDGRLAPVAIEALGAGGRLAAALGQELSAVLVGSGIVGPAQEAVAYGATKVHVVDAPILQDYATEPYLQALETVIRQSAPAVVLLGQTPQGRDLAPWLALRLDTGATMDCMALDIDPDTRRLLMTRPVYGGNAQAVQICRSDPQIATIRLKAMAPAVRDDARQGQVVDATGAVEPAASERQREKGRTDGRHQARRRQGHRRRRPGYRGRLRIPTACRVGRASGRGTGGHPPAV